MKSGTLFAAVGAALAPVTTTLALAPRSTGGKGYIALPVQQVKSDLFHLSRRDAIQSILKNNEFYYSTNISIGTPAQQVTVLLDTGSSELWVNPDCNTAPTAAQTKQCKDSGSYNPLNSQTPPIGPMGTRKLNYGDTSDTTTQTSAEIAYYADSITIGASVIQNQTFGVVTKSDGIATGILGLAPDLKVGFTPGQPYSLMLNSLADQGLIESRVFSLDLRPASADAGALIYGGLDKGKFIGELQHVPMVNGTKGEPRLAVNLSGVGLKIGNVNKNYPLVDVDQNVMLDSGTTLTRLHPSLARPILTDLKATADQDGYFIADCSLRNNTSDSYVSFSFGKKTILVPLSQFILDLGPRDGQCYIGLVTTTDQQILGDSMMRAGYFIFDWDNKLVHMAQASTCGKEEIVVIGKGQDAVPSGIVGLCDGPAAPDGDGNNTAKSSSSSAQSSSSSSSSPQNTGVSIPGAAPSHPAASSTSDSHSGASALTKDIFSGLLLASLLTLAAASWNL